ncbi:MAG: hypothetical protein LBR18_08825, partial [Tannerella sp.]|nr:hypothetical protein [Tannerella sp.]
MIITVRAPRRLDFDISLPASKSISARVLVMNALANRPAILKNISDCDDTTALISALSTDKPRHSEPDSPRQCEPATPRHCEERSNPAPANLNSQFSILNSKLDIGPAGTAMRFLTAYYASCPVTDVILTGSERMKNRPIALLVDALRQLGADISYTEKEGYPPLHIRGRRLQGGEISLDGGVSSQYISALLMTAPVMTDGLTLHLTGDIISQPYINLTLSLMRQFGIETAETNETGNPENSSNALNSANSKNKEQLRTTKINNQTYSPPAVFTVESDWSAASYWYEITALSRDAG